MNLIETQHMAFEKWQTPYEELSERAIEILRLLGEGLSDREISERLVITINTVKWYNRQIYGILGVKSRTQAIVRAHELQLLDKNKGSLPSAQKIRRLPKHNLPVESTHFIGRKQEQSEIKHLLETARLLTLVGPPGTGKTRLALRIAWDITGVFHDGVYFISLVSISDPQLG
jgi:DNA-binding CsgD family transcriptional regulator